MLKKLDILKSLFWVMNLHQIQKRDSANQVKLKTLDLGRGAENIDSLGIRCVTCQLFAKYVRGRCKFIIYEKRYIFACLFKLKVPVILRFFRLEMPVIFCLYGWRCLSFSGYCVGYACHFLLI